MTITSALTHSSAEPSPSVTHSSTTPDDLAAQFGLPYSLPHQYTVPLTVPSDFDVWQQLATTSTSYNASLQSSMATQPAAAAAAAAGSECEGLTTVPPERRLVIAEENDSSRSTLRTPELGSEVFLKFHIILLGN